MTAIKIEAPSSDELAAMVEKLLRHDDTPYDDNDDGARIFDREIAAQAEALLRRYEMAKAAPAPATAPLRDFDVEIVLTDRVYRTARTTIRAASLDEAKDLATRKFDCPDACEGADLNFEVDTSIFDCAKVEVSVEDPKDGRITGYQQTWEG